MVHVGRGARDTSRGKILPLSAFGLLFIYAVVQLQSDIPSRWTAFLRLGSNLYATEEAFPVNNEDVTNFGTLVPTPVGGTTEQNQPNVETGSSTSKVAAPEIIDIDGQQQGGSNAAEQVAASGQVPGSELKVSHQVFRQKCTEKGQSGDVKNEIQEHLAKILTPPTTVRKLAENDPVEQCQSTFIDLGANIGRSIRFIVVRSSIIRF